MDKQTTTAKRNRRTRQQVEALQHQIRAMRAKGVTFEAIGEQVGLSRQAVKKHFDDFCENVVRDRRAEPVFRAWGRRIIALEDLSEEIQRNADASDVGSSMKYNYLDLRARRERELVELEKDAGILRKYPDEVMEVFNKLESMTPAELKQEVQRVCTEHLSRSASVGSAPATSQREASRVQVMRVLENPAHYKKAAPSARSTARKEAPVDIASPVTVPVALPTANVPQTPTLPARPNR